MKITFAGAKIPATGALAMTVAKGGKLGPHGAKLDKKTGGILSKAIKSNRFDGNKNQTLAILAPARTKLTRLVLVGIGKPGDADEKVMENAGGTACAVMAGGKETSATIFVDSHDGLKLADGDAAAHAGYGALLRSYRFDKYLTKTPADKKPVLKGIAVATGAAAAARKSFAALEGIAEGVFFTRDLVSEPANIIYPETLAAECLKLKKLGVKVEILDEKQMKKLGMGALLGVAQGSARPGRLVTMLWNGNPGAKDKRPVAFIGKGVTFDTGGISIKPAAGMEDMKWDMGGAGAVIGAMRALAANKTKANVIGAVGLVENMPSGTAQRPGDIVTSMSGQTIEVLNTDAEGRLVLADVIWYVQQKFKPRTVVNLATLTGAIIVSLGHEYAGLFSNNDALAQQLAQAGTDVEEKLWRFPLGDAYDRDINSDAADMKNIGSGRGAGSITAAQFIKRFIQDGVAWAHLDIAGVAWTKETYPTVPKGASGFGVRLLCKYIENMLAKAA